MKNHFIDTLRWAGLSLAAVAMAALTACTNEDNATEPSAGARTYTVCIPASLNEGAQTRAVSFSGTECTSTFKTSEKVYVYNATSSKMLLNGDGSDLGCLHPASISDDGTKCSLEGTLTGNIAAGDKLTLFYNINGDDSTPEENSYYYGYQDGTAAGALDGAIATVTVSDYSGGTLTTTATASFTNLQSMFRFQFQDEGSSAITVKGLKIESKKDALSSIYYPLKSGAEQYNPDYISVIPATATSDYIYVALCIDENASAGDELTFTVTGSDDKVYQGSKAAPSGGFKNGNYYYNTAPIALTYQYQLQKPTITWTRCDYDPEPDPVDFYWAVRGTWNDVLNDFNNDIDFTLSGTSYGYSFIMDNAGTVRLNGLNATMVNDNVIQCNGGDLTVDITGANTLTCKDVSHCIYADENLKLSGSGTLTVTASVDNYCGLWGCNNYTNANNSYETTEEMDVSAQLAADGVKVTRSARTDNADGTYTWTYTVEPIPLAVKRAGGSTYTAVTGDITLANGDVLTGTLDGATQKYKVSIAAGATVTLRNATINGVHTDDSHELWAGLTCLGDATIILEGTNAVQNFNRDYPGIQPGPTGTTLTIRGSGQLTATGRSSGAGIGTKDGGGSCGNIRIEGGNVTANGGNNSAGIGSSYNSTCGDITICGSASVTATGGYYNGAGIGSGYGDDGTSQCGKIEISGSAQVTATGGGNGAGIGSGHGYDGTSQCGNIEISGSAQVTANGGKQGAGIGSGFRGTCGNISISGGTVMAKGVSEATGIGTGRGDDNNKAVCGDISITKGEGFVSVTAIRGSGAERSIGTTKGENNESYKCGSIMFDGTQLFDGAGDGSYGVPDDEDYENLHFAKSTTNVPDGINPGDDEYEKYRDNTWTLTP